jgi:hypothetical protein
VSSLRFVLALFASLSLFACENDEGGDESNAGQLGQSCIGGTFCNEGLVCSQGVCMAGDDEAEGDGDSSEDESESESGDGDGDTSSDTGTPQYALYEGPCENSDECVSDQWCAADEGRSWCAKDCTSDADCPMHPTATAVPRCEYLDEIGGLNPKQGCVLECQTEAECLVGAQCFYTGIADKDWCGFLP